MSTCFVIQPFDGDKFDARYDQVLAPAIEEAGLEPYRIDQDPSVNTIIEDIHSKIRSSALCLADITTPNPNVWYEIGYAKASSKEVIYVCSQEVKKFPFDISHTRIINYKSDAPDDFKKLQKDITDRIKALLSKEKILGSISQSPIKEVEGLSQHEEIVLAIIMQNRETSTDPVFTTSIFNDMERAGRNKLASNIALTTLSRKKLIDITEFNDSYNKYFGYFLTESGENWVIENQDKLNLQHINSGSAQVSKKSKEATCDDIPF